MEATFKQYVKLLVAKGCQDVEGACFYCRSDDRDDSSELVHGTGCLFVKMREAVKD